jgi:lipopolysaccharide export system permease protein
MHAKLSFPLVSIIMAILGVPFAIRHGRSGGVAAGIFLAVVIAVIYWIVLAMGLALGHSGALSPILAAWGSHVLFGSAGVYMLSRVDF